MLSRSVRAKLLLIPVVAAIAGGMWVAYAPRGYHYEFHVEARTVVDETPRGRAVALIAAEAGPPGAAATAVATVGDAGDRIPTAPSRWEGYGLERRSRLPFGGATRRASIVRRSGEIPVLADTITTTNSFGTQTARRDLGDAEEILGFPTRKIVLTADDTLYVRGAEGKMRLARTARTETVMWVTSELTGVGRRFTFLADSISMLAAGRSPRAVRDRHKAGDPSIDGVPLRIESTAVAFDSLGRRRETVTTGAITSFDRRWVSSRELQELSLSSQRLEHERRGRALSRRS